MAEALAAIKNAIDDARAAVAAGIDGLAIEPTLAPIKKGARVIREIAWRLREIGADGRICDLIDSQVRRHRSRLRDTSRPIDPKNTIGAAFDRIEARIAEFDEGRCGTCASRCRPVTRPGRIRSSARRPAVGGDDSSILRGRDRHRRFAARSRDGNCHGGRGGQGRGDGRSG